MFLAKFQHHCRPEEGYPELPDLSDNPLPLVGRTTFRFSFSVAFKSWINGLRSVLSFAGSVLNKFRVLSL